MAGSGKAKVKNVHWLEDCTGTCVLIMAACCVVLLAIISLSSAQQRYDLKKGSYSRYTINASREVEDTVTTEELRRKAAAEVVPAYKQQDGVSEQVQAGVNQVLSELLAVQKYGQGLGGDGGFAPEELEYARSLVTQVSLTDSQLTTLMETKDETFTALAAAVRNAVSSVMSGSVREDQVSDAITSMLSIVGYQMNISPYRSIVYTVLRSTVRANMVIDQESTKEAQQRAMDAVEPVFYQQGQNIIREGDAVTEKHIQLLKALGLLTDEKIDWSVYAGVLIMIVLATAMCLMILRMLHSSLVKDQKRMLVLAIVLVLSTVFNLVAKELHSMLLAPIAFGAMMLTVLLGKNAGIAGCVTMSLVSCTLALGSNSTGTTDAVFTLVGSLTSGLLSVRLLNKRPQRMRVLVVSLAVAAFNMLALVAIRLMMATNNLTVLTESAELAAAGGVLSGLLVIALQPLMETVFNLATYSKLLELSNPNIPLLRRLLLEAPGTYHHSIIVANLAEAAAESVGANALLCRTAAYFHDVGKLMRPQYFKENQMGENPHDSIPPEQSARILTSHPRDGAQLARDAHLPREIQQIILEHHGDTPVMYFYHKAMQQADGTPVDINLYRYAGPRPSIRESAIVMLADTVEAAVRSLPNPTPAEIHSTIRRLVKGKLDDGQLDQAPLTLRDIDRICASFATVMNGIYHERIEYPKTETEQTVALPPQPPAARQEEELEETGDA